MLKRRSRNRQSSAIDHVNITPVLDVMLTILVAFILIAPHLKHGIITDIPQAYGESIQESDSQTISVERDGKLYFNRDEVTMPELRQELERLGPGITIYLEASEQAQYKYFVEVLGLLRELGIQNIDLATRPRTG